MRNHSKMVGLRVTKEEHKVLETLADVRGTTISKIIRSLIKPAFMNTYTIRTIVSYAQTNTVQAMTEEDAKALSAELTLNNLTDATVEYDHDIEAVGPYQGWLV